MAELKTGRLTGYTTLVVMLSMVFSQNTSELLMDGLTTISLVCDHFVSSGYSRSQESGKALALSCSQLCISPLLICTMKA